MWVVLGLASALGSALLGGVADRVGKRGYVLWATAAVAILLLLLGRIGGVGGLVAVGLPLAVLSASRSAALLALLSGLVEPGMRGTLMGVRAAAVNVGTGLFPLIAGYVYAGHGFPTFLKVAALAVASAFFCVRWFVREKAR
jgi:predicted MFS family arabinose efflux permease